MVKMILSYVGIVIVLRTEQNLKAEFEIATRDVGRDTLVRAWLPTSSHNASLLNHSFQTHRDACS